MTSASTTASNATTSTTTIGRRLSGMQSKDNNSIADVLKKADLAKKNMPSKLPAIDLNQAKKSNIIPKGSIKAIPTGPIKP